MPDPLAHLGLLAQLLDVARASAHYPDSRRVLEWVALISRAWPGRAVPRVELHPVSGLPTRRSLARLLQRQRLARAFFAARKVRPRRVTDEFNTALAAAELFQPGLEVRPVSLERAVQRVLVVHDRFDAKTGTLLRYSVQLEQRGNAKHVRVEKGDRPVASGPFALAVEQACDGDATACALRLDALEGLRVSEVVRGELGPLHTRQVPGPGPLSALAGAGAVLSLSLERVGETVSADAVADAWPPPDPYALPREKRGWHRSRERRLMCAPEVEAEVRAAVVGSRMLVRCR